MDIISRLPGCAGQVADAVSAYPPDQSRRCINVIENSKVRLSRYSDTSTWRPSFLRRRKEVSRRTNHSPIRNCSEMSVFDTHCGPDILWSVNKLARAITKWTRSWDKRLVRLISYILIQLDIDKILLWEIQHNSADLIVWRLWFCRRPRSLRINLMTLLCIFGRQKFVPISWMFKKQTSVSHSSTEAELISLDTGLRIDDIPALTPWHLMIEVFHSVTNNTEGPKRELRGNSSTVVKSNMQHLIQIKHISVIPTNVDNIPSNTKFLLQCHVVCLWEKWEGNRNDDQRSKSHNETWFAIPQSYTGFVIWQN